MCKIVFQWISVLVLNACGLVLHPVPQSTPVFVCFLCQVWSADKRACPFNEAPAPQSALATSFFQKRKQKNKKLLCYHFRTYHYIIQFSLHNSLCAEKNCIVFQGPRGFCLSWVWTCHRKISNTSNLTQTATKSPNIFSSCICWFPKKNVRVYSLSTVLYISP